MTMKLGNPRFSDSLRGGVMDYYQINEQALIKDVRNTIFFETYVKYLKKVKKKQKGILQAR